MTVRQALQKVREILENPKYPQITGALVKYLEDGSIGKCALGEISCQVGLPLIIEQHGKKFIDPTVSFDYPKILFKAGFPSYLTQGFNLPSFSFNKGFYFGEDEDNILPGSINLQNYIYNLNDNHFTYPQIIEFLEETFGGIED